MKLKSIVFFTGAGVSAESGLQTFRESKDGLWNNYKIEDVCTPQAWIKNPSLVLDFYNLRREQCQAAKPNKAHELIAQLEQFYNVVVVTQNVDDLHERAGSSKIIHLHGELMKSRSTIDSKLIYKCSESIHLNDKCEKGSQLRPYIVWFGEMLEDSKIDEAIRYVMECDICVIIGTSLQVYPANEIPSYVSEKCELILIDPNSVSHSLGSKRVKVLQQTAIEGMEELFRDLI
jgi:NAD-dependent deacetylase